MKEVTRYEAMAGTWKAKTPNTRQKLLQKLKVDQKILLTATEIYKASRQDSWSKLSTPLKVFLGARFSDGKFSEAHFEQQQRGLKAISDEIDEVERRIA